jgi:hypothetical protein
LPLRYAKESSDCREASVNGPNASRP